MTIRTKLLVSALIPITVILLIAVVAILTGQQMDRTIEARNVTDKMAQTVSDLNLLTSDYALLGQERAQLQWQAAYQSVGDTISALEVTTPEGQAVLDRLTDTYEGISVLFSQMVRVRGEESPGHEEVLNIMAIQLLLGSQSMVTDCNILSDVAAEEFLSARQHAAWFFWPTIIAVVVAALLASFLIYRSIAKPIRELKEGTKIIGAGNLEHKVDTAAKDEIGELSRAFNQMTEQLKVTTVSRDQLTEEVAERKQMEAVLQQSERNYRTLFDTALEGVAVIDGETLRVVICNQSATSMFGFDSPEEAIGLDPLSVIHPDDIERTAKIMLQDGFGKDLREVNEFRLIKKDGRELWVSAVGAITEYQGRPVMMVSFRDITQRKHAEDALRQSEKKYRTLAEQAPVGICNVDLQGTVTYVNKRFEEVSGYSREEVLDKNGLELGILADETSKLLAKGIEDVLRGKPASSLPTPLEIQFKCKGGRWIWVELGVSLVKQSGVLVGFQVVSRDITKRREAEEALRQSEEKLRAVFESATEGIIVTDLEGNIVDLNNTAVHLHGYSGKEELIGRKVYEVLQSKKGSAAAIEDMRRTVETGCSGTVERTFLTKDGREFPAELSIVVLRDELGNPAGAVSTVRDITERKLAEETLKQSEERYRTILEDMEDSYFEVDLAGNLTFTNNSTCRNLRYSRKELIGLNFKAFTAEEDAKAVYQAFNRVYRTGKPVKALSWKVVRKDGNIGFAEAVVFPLRNQEGGIVGFRGVGRDVTERKRMEEERRELEQKAYLASRLASVGEMASGIAHEINNPLTGVIGYAQLLMGKDIPKDAREDLKTIYEGGQRVASIVRRLLTFARQYKPHRDYVIINDIINTTLHLRAYELETNNIKTNLRLNRDLPATIADAGQLQQVFLNLIINAETEMKLAHGTGKLSIKTEAIDNTIRMSFKDDGPGIAKENLDKIFDPFFTTREVGEGTGLGLSVCHGIIAEHGGRIYAESKLGKGATFIVELPIVTEPKQMELAEPAADEAQKMAKAKILVVDDEPTILQFLSQLLTDEGHEVETVDNADDALEMVESKRYSLILLDVKMPGTSGMELYKRIQRIAKSLARRVVFITGDVIGAETTAFLSQTKARYITKPFDAEQLKKEINRILTQNV